MIEQSLCHHLQSQLTEYYKLIAILESQMGFIHKTDDPKSPSPLDLADVREEETGLTLKRLDVWINEWRLRMRMMSVCVEGAKGNIITLLQSRSDMNGLKTETHGGALVNMIHGYTDNGDPFIRKFTDQLLEEVNLYYTFDVFYQIGFSTGVKAFLRHFAQVDLFWRTIRSMFRVFCGDGSRVGQYAIWPPIVFAWAVLQ
jgi:hypothetical protein